MAARYAVGIDLGTTHTAVAYSPLDRSDTRPFALPQLVDPGLVAARPLLPSALYLPADGELPPEALRLPWGSSPFVTGELARRLGASSPARLVVSAKSWLSHAGVDRRAAILPWGAPVEVPHVSPVEAQARVLAHVRAAWDHAFPRERLAEQEVVLTVPASFDEAARELTVLAAREAGLGSLRLLEEPQAAFQDWLGGAGPEALTRLRLVLVADVGGGTTDFTLVRVRPGAIDRVAVGDHLILGGDNMDVTLARVVETALGGASLDAASWSALAQSARTAKEALLSESGGPLEISVTLPGRGSRLVGGARSHVLPRDEVEKLLLEGFLPLTPSTEVPERRRVALTELGLPYAADPAISRHLALFLRRHAAAAAGSGVEVHEGLPRPDAVLLAGGVWKGAVLVQRLSELLTSWYGAPVPLLRPEGLDLAVARGAAAHGLARRGLATRIGGGSARSYFVGVETQGNRSAICVVPRGLAEGVEVETESRTFSLVLGRPVSFPLYTSTDDRADAPGDVISADALDPLPPLHTVLRSEAAGEIPVTIRAQLTEIGTLEISLREADGGRRWRLEFATREGGGGTAFAPSDELPRRFEEARAIVERAFGRKAQDVEVREIKNLWRALERVIGERATWSSAVSRELWGVVMGGAAKRRRTPEHERVFFQLAGFCLRPGFGAPLDEWRVSEVWKLFPQGVQYTTEKAGWAEWWILWRRICGGLDAGRQRQLLDAVRPWLKVPEGRSPPKPKGPRAEGHEEMVRLAASLERLAPADKLEIAGWIDRRLESGAGGRSFWPYGRLLARVPFAGSAHDVVPPEGALPWLEKLLAEDLRRADGAAFAASRIAQRTGDRARDFPEDVRERVALKLEAAGVPPPWIRGVRDVVEVAPAESARVFGETLPSGLRLA